MRQTQQQNGRLEVGELRRQISDWNLKYRISEKISSWGIGYSARKIAEIPQEFIADSFLFYLLKVHPQLISDYQSTNLLTSLMALKKTYTAHSIQYFKQNENFNFALVVLSKLLRYFLLSNFPKLKSPQNLEAHIFATVTYALIGYPIDLSAYPLIEQKLKQKKKDKLDRASQSLDESVDKQLRKTVDKKIRRWGLQGCLLNTHEHKELEHFRLEIQQSLRTRVPLPRKEKEETDKNKTKNQYSCENFYPGFQQTPEISFHQISAAMMANQGFNSPKNSPKIQLSRLTKTKQHASHGSHTFSTLSKENSVSFDSKQEKPTSLQGQKCSLLAPHPSQKQQQKTQISQKQPQFSEKWHYKKWPKKDNEEEVSTDCVLLTLDNRLSEECYARLRKKVGTSTIPKIKHVRSEHQFMLPKISKE